MSTSETCVDAEMSDRLCDRGSSPTALELFSPSARKSLSAEATQAYPPRPHRQAFALGPDPFRCF
eukprot:6524017-Pyramimonas_sp.AAC.2